MHVIIHFVQQHHPPRPQSVVMRLVWGGMVAFAVLWMLGALI